MLQLSLFMMDARIPEQGHLKRREWIGLVIEIAGASLLADPLRAREHSHEASGADAKAAGPWTPIFLNRGQNETLVKLGEAIIPGSKDAQCNRIIDLVLSIDLEKNKIDVQNALATFDTAARKQYSRPLVNLASADLHQLLVDASSSHSSRWPAFSLLKEWLADSYWSSKKGLQELGWTGRLAWTKFDGCPEHAGGQV
jgi:hypothetical protein